MSHRIKPGSAVGIFTAVLMAAIAAGSSAETAKVGTYICSVDNCRKQYLMRSEKLLDACRTGVENAVKTGPASSACLEMCDTSYPGEASALHQACTEGCSLFESACLRDGKIPPRENRGRTDNRPKPNY